MTARNQRAQDLGGETIRLVRPSSGRVAVPVSGRAGANVRVGRQQHLSHDIRHQLGTVMMLASVLAGGDDVGPDGRRTASQLLEEARWLLELQNAYNESAADD